MLSGSTPTAQASYALPLGSASALGRHSAPPLPSEPLLPSRRIVVIAPLRPPRSWVSLSYIGSSVARWAPPPMSVLPSVIPMVLSGCQPPWLHPPAPPPCITVLAVAWVITCLSLFKAIHWITPLVTPSTFPLVPLPDSRCPPVLLHLSVVARPRLFGRRHNVTVTSVWTLFLLLPFPLPCLLS